MSPPPSITDNAPTESTALLPSLRDAGNGTFDPIDPSAGLGPEGADAHECPLNGDVRDGLERQESNTSTRKYDGMPEVKKRMPYIMPALGIGVLLAAADQTIVVSSSGKIGSDLDALNATSWVATAYFLTLTAFQPLYGKLSDIFGRKHCLLFAYVVFGVSCLCCGLAKTMPQLIVARAVAGIGGGGMTTVVSILLSDIVSLRDRGSWQGYINIIYATGAAAGAPVGGILADSIGWRWSFLVQAPLCLLAFIAVTIFLPDPQSDKSHWRQKFRRIDFLGAVILLIAVVCLLVGMDRGSNKSWTDKYTLATVLSSIPLFIIFAIVEKLVAQEPFTPGRIIFGRTLFAAYLCNFFGFAGHIAAMFFLPLYFQAISNLSATQAGVRMIPVVLCSVIGSLSGGIYMKVTGRYFWITVMGYILLVVGMTIMLLCSGVVVNSQAGLVVGLSISAFTNGNGVTTTLIAIISNAKPEDQAIATACSYLFRSLGSVIGVSLCATALNSALRIQLNKQLGTGPEIDKIIDNIRHSLEYVKSLDPKTRAVVEHCYGEGLQAAFELCLIFVAGAAIFSWFIKEKRLEN